MECMFIDAEVS